VVGTKEGADRGSDRREEGGWWGVRKEQTGEVRGGRREGGGWGGGRVVGGDGWRSVNMVTGEECPRGVLEGSGVSRHIIL